MIFAISSYFGSIAFVGIYNTIVNSLFETHLLFAPDIEFFLHSGFFKTSSTGMAFIACLCSTDKLPPILKY
jgi:hypothetical protein